MNHGCVCSCVGPIIDAKMKCKVFDFEKFMIIQIRLVQRYVFLPSVYDALLVIRPSCNFIQPISNVQMLGLFLSQFIFICCCVWIFI